MLFKKKHAHYHLIAVVSFSFKLLSYEAFGSNHSVRYNTDQSKTLVPGVESQNKPLQERI